MGRMPLWLAAAGATLVSLTSSAGAQPAPDGGAPPAATAVAHPARLVVENASNVDLAFDFAVDGKRVPGCFWVLAGKTTSFALPAEKVRWSYAVSVMQLVGSVELSADQPKKLSCKAWTNRYGDEDAKCELAPAPEALPAEDSSRALAESALGFLQTLGDALAKKDKKGIAPLVALPLELSWLGEKPGKKKLKSAAQLIASRAKLGLDGEWLARAKAAGGVFSGADDCEKNAVDYTRGEPALECKGREVVVTWRQTPACDKARPLDTFRLVSTGSAWKLAEKGARDPKPAP